MTPISIECAPLMFPVSRRGSSWQRSPAAERARNLNTGSILFDRCLGHPILLALTAAIVTFTILDPSTDSSLTHHPSSVGVLTLIVSDMVALSRRPYRRDRAV